ncbi:Uncharacterized protein dnm_060010 [Desulfonema magnum]|uniref:Uncharacterized protein n=1 Tax=Desulfonema magnum TaxID=45655 RepID=A0A975BR74_9BACT|nr:Uncharacterized protein dnm_060010 [Desulfonema magnum]
MFPEALIPSLGEVSEKIPPAGDAPGKSNLFSDTIQINSPPVFREQKKPFKP